MPTRATVAALVLGVLAGVAPAYGQEPAEQNACAAADALRAAGEDKEARKQYVTLLTESPGLGCAQTGLAAVNEPAPDKTTGEAKKLCRRGDVLRDVNREADAITAYKAALEKRPRIRCAKKGLEEAGPSTMSRTLAAIPAVLADLALIAGIAALVFFVFMLLGHIERIRPLLLRAGFVGRVLAPKITFAALDDKSGKDVGAVIVARVKDRLLRARDEAAGRTGLVYELDVATARESAVTVAAGDRGLQAAIEKASEVSEHAKIVTALLGLLYTLLPIRRIDIEGVVEPPAEKDCASATLTLTRDGTLRAASTLKGPVSKTALTHGDYVRLADPTAVWMQYEIARALRDDDRDFGPNAAEAYALIREGLERYAAGDHDQARKFYGRALEANPASWTARVNLAVAEAQLAGEFVIAVGILAEGYAEANA
jgi:tetratricopeptide (TPR) repeat protein